jgi:hypothetical protein
MIGVQHKLPTLQFQCCKISIGVAYRHAHHVSVKLHRNPHILHQQIHRKLRQSSAVLIRRHKGIARSSLRHDPALSKQWPKMQR